MNRSKRLRGIGLDDLEAILREWLEAYDKGWRPKIYIPLIHDERAEQVRFTLEGGTAESAERKKLSGGEG